LDPPFYSGKQYKSRGAIQVKAFDDTWQWDQIAAEAYQEIVAAGGKPAHAMQAFHLFLGDSGLLAYLVMVAQRLIELRRVLKDTGSIYLHCDWHASHYLKMLMDAVFGNACFVNEIVWAYKGTGAPRKGFKRKHDVLLFYCKTNDFFFDIKAAGELMTETTKCKFTMVDKDQRRYKQYKHPDGTYHRQYFDPSKLTRKRDVWEVSTIQSWNEKIGYPTQKPEALLERIIKASSNEGDTVLDCFCGSGTTLAVAQRLGRHWIGIDIADLAISLTRDRLQKLIDKKPRESFF